MVEGRGPVAVQQLYPSLPDGRVPPDQGHILSLARCTEDAPFLHDPKQGRFRTGNAAKTAAA